MTEVYDKPQKTAFFLCREKKNQITLYYILHEKKVSVGKQETLLSQISYKYREFCWSNTGRKEEILESN